ncbi:transaldolase [Asticcacaulis sp.]|uniref:transaldolase n=1 Tax=Asticcacaulis sp. TaxID=1872648 RepID=UPI002BA9AEBD|nr:transaldolase [Asticcacaulis sp.]HTM83265.1 transaldolase [Asticcacaulis sp.]
MNPLQQLEACGQAPWLDYLIRSLIEKGELKALIDHDGLKGVTSNPSIFQKAIGESDEYTAAIRDFRAGGERTTAEIYEHLAITDIQAAADVLGPVYDRTNGRDGYVSLECSPLVANDTDATIAEAIHLWTAVNRPNLMVKVPGTAAGIPAIRKLVSRGININITLLFSVATYEEVVEAYLSGLETLKATGADLSKVASVASFFVSRIDTAVDRQLSTLSNKAAAEKLHGRVAIANAKIAYAHYKALFAGPRWEALAAAGAQTQRLLWASTSVKDATLKDTLYVEALIGRDTVNTLPPATMDAFRTHGVVRADAIEDDEENARSTLAALQAQGISLDDITAQLVRDGVQSFVEAFDTLFKSIADLPRA